MKLDLTVKDMCVILGIAEATAYNWRSQKPPKGPRGFVRWNGGRKEVRYRRSVVLAWKKRHWDFKEEKGGAA